MKAHNKASQQDEATSPDNRMNTAKTIIEYCCPHCGQVCTEVEVQQGFCTACDQE